jgi:hypothetical protein
VASNHGCGIGPRGRAERRSRTSVRPGGSITITGDQAMAEFMNRELPKWEAECRQALPNYDLLPGDSAGAIDSLASTLELLHAELAGKLLADKREAIRLRRP